ncbi:MAG: hypothetical protein ACLFTY_01735 [Candidatus Aenigmatarchaeota archaeon]
MKKTPLILFGAGVILAALLMTVSFETKGLDHEKTINRAQEYSERQEVCTDQHKQLVSPDGEVEYEAPDGCEISFLEERGWRPPGEKAPEQRIVTTCLDDEECGWVSTNCCSENMGASWECVNKEETVLDCPEKSVCPAVMNPKPVEDCVCVDGSCEATDGNEGVIK